MQLKCKHEILKSKYWIKHIVVCKCLVFGKCQCKIKKIAYLWDQNCTGVRLQGWIVCQCHTRRPVAFTGLKSEAQETVIFTFRAFNNSERCAVSWPGRWICIQRQQSIFLFYTKPIHLLVCFAIIHWILAVHIISFHGYFMLLMEVTWMNFFYWL